MRYPVGEPTANVTTAHQWLNQDDDRIDLYNSHDVVGTARTFKGLLRALRDNGQLEFWRREVWPTVPVVMKMQARGLRVDLGRRTAYRKRLRRELAETEFRIHQFTKAHDYKDFVRAKKAGETQWLNSTQGGKNVPVGGHRAAWLYDELGFKVPPATDERPWRSTSQPALKWILAHLRKKDEHLVPALHALFHRSRLNVIDTRYLNFPIGSDGRVRPRIKDFNVETGRLAYADPALQQYPEEARCFIVADPGKVFVSADYSQLEAVIQAYASNDRVTIKAIEEGRSIHCQNAADLFGGTPDQYAKGTPVYDFAKSFLYKLSYGGSADSDKEKVYCPCIEWGCYKEIGEAMALTPAEKRQVEARWWARHQPVRRWRNELLESTRITGCYTTPLGRKRYFAEPYPAYKRALFNFPMQATAADLIKRAMRALDHKYDAPLVLQMHDELMLEVPKADVAHWEDALRETMSAPVPELGGVRFQIATKVGEVWGEL